ncbi:spheroidene monooxygenase [Cereibacter sphaeroides]|uniref:spheroidene monooxygenase n=2 Tax=Alphaproteobacteria TaxID=28211 RepID=UPI001F1744E9|nr:spheroidene monooxygenase [Cereibacter sphaeroides]MCE6950893.1 spheroidene monooxygenase [Cereibacter sphaeroides]
MIAPTPSAGGQNMQTVTLSIFRFTTPEKRLWVFSQMVANKLGMHYMPKAKFWKMLGSGTGEGFTPKPNWNVWGMIGVWEDEETARREVAESPIYKKWAEIADESYTVLLNPINGRGKWDNSMPFDVTKPGQPGEVDPDDVRPIAALTRATLNFWKIERFWSYEPPISHMIGKDANVVFKIGMGEIPFSQQMTFSVWPDSESMVKFAYGSGAHAEAIKKGYEEGWFKEALFARFKIAGTIGKWEGKDPVGDALKQFKRAEAPKPAPAAVAPKPAPAVEAPKPAPAMATAAPAAEAPKPAPAPVASKPVQHNSYKGKPGKGGRKENA